MLIDDVASTVREAALVVFKRRAEQRGTIITVCSECKAFLEERDGEGRSGLNDSCCERCFERIKEGVTIQ